MRSSPTYKDNLRREKDLLRITGGTDCQFRVSRREIQSILSVVLERFLDNPLYDKYLRTELLHTSRRKEVCLSKLDPQVPKRNPKGIFIYVLRSNKKTPLPRIVKQSKSFPIDTRFYNSCHSDLCDFIQKIN